MNHFIKLLVIFIGLCCFQNSYAQNANSGVWTIQKAITMENDDIASTWSCGRTGTKCTFSSECCEGRCNANNVCGGGAFCDGNGESCNIDSECCSKICSRSGKCSLSEDNSCKATGDSCTFSSECCGGRCNANNVCGGGAFCEGTGVKCSFNNECCSNYCSRTTNTCQ